MSEYLTRLLFLKCGNISDEDKIRECSQIFTDARKLQETLLINDNNYRLSSDNIKAQVREM